MIMLFEYGFKLDMYLKYALICLHDISHESVEALNYHFANAKFTPKNVKPDVMYSTIVTSGY